MKNFRFSTFEKWLIWITLLIIGWIKLFSSDIPFGRPFLIGPLIILTGSSMLILYNNFLEKLFVLKYRIREETSPSGSYIFYKAEVLTFHFFFIIWWSWEPVRSESLYSYEQTNVFGAKWERTVYTGKSYDSKEEALAETEKHRLEIKENRNKFFKRPKPKEQKITYV